LLLQELEVLHLHSVLLWSELNVLLLLWLALRLTQVGGELLEVALGLLVVLLRLLGWEAPLLSGGLRTCILLRVDGRIEERGIWVREECVFLWWWRWR
jgi:hypothetical protein